MNYRHAYHAGNFADVMKHVILLELIHSLLRKETAFCYLDTHAGTGLYDLRTATTQKSQEYLHGIAKIIPQKNPPIFIQHYLEAIRKTHHAAADSDLSTIRYYPGSPLLVRYLLRPQDRIIACELHPQEHHVLKNTFSRDKQIAIHNTDGFLGLKAFLPPRERRGLVLIDPPYENPDEFTHIAHSLSVSLKHWESGIYAIWYPIKEKNRVLQFHRLIKQLVKQPILAAELTIHPDMPSHLNGSGLLIINPPWQFDQHLKTMLSWLWKALTINNQGGYQAHFLK